MLVSRFARRTSVLFPVEPATAIFRNVGISMLLRQLGSRTTSHARPAVKDDFLIHFRLGETETVFELLFRQEQSVRLGLDGKVDRSGNMASFEFRRFTNVCLFVRLVDKITG